ncbi:MAG TPA: hypothetical protein PK626_00390 [Bacteroidales bacterium]|nr:hypothetical protein [Bacteroidales bacterium]
MENLNLIEILKNVPKGTKLYSPIFGECELNVVSDNFICVSGKHGGYLYKDGTYYEGCGECLLFPSKENRDWSTFKIEKEDFSVGDYVKVKSSDKVYLIKQIKETGVLVSDIINSSNDFEFPIDKSIISEKVTKFDPKWLKPFDRILVRNEDSTIWIATLFSHIDNKEQSSYVTIDGFLRKFCIPFNAETKHLVGTSDEEPEFYRIY